MPGQDPTYAGGVALPRAYASASRDELHDAGVDAEDVSSMTQVEN